MTTQPSHSTDIPPQSSQWAKHWDLDPTVHFLNHGSFGACPRVVREEQREWQNRIERQPVQFLARDVEALLDNVRETLGNFLGTHADNLALVTNATTGVNTVLRGLTFGPDDELVVTDHEYNACRNTLNMAASRWNAKVVVAKVPCPLETPQDVVDALVDAVTPKTRLVLVDYITSATGIIFPAKEICHAMNQRGVDVLVDGAHAPGMVPVNLDDLGAAYFTGNCHKWLCTPKGSAVLYVRPDRQVGLSPLVVSHGANSRRKDRSRFRLEHDWTGTCDPSPWLCIPKAIEFLGGLMSEGLDGLRRHNTKLVVGGRQRLVKAIETIVADRGTPADPIVPCPESMLGSLSTLLLPTPPVGKPYAEENEPVGEDPLQTALRERHHIDLPISYWSPLQRRTLRISAQAYNEPRQYEHLANALLAERELV